MVGLLFIHILEKACRITPVETSAWVFACFFGALRPSGISWLVDAVCPRSCESVGLRPVLQTTLQADGPKMSPKTTSEVHGLRSEAQVAATRRVRGKEAESDVGGSVCITHSPAGPTSDAKKYHEV